MSINARIGRICPYFDFSSRTRLVLSIEHVTPYIANNDRKGEGVEAARVCIWLGTRSRDLRQQMHPERNQFAFHRELNADNLLPLKETQPRCKGWQKSLDWIEFPFFFFFLLLFSNTIFSLLIYIAILLQISVEIFLFVSSEDSMNIYIKHPVYTCQSRYTFTVFGFHLESAFSCNWENTPTFLVLVFRKWILVD